MPQFEQLDLNPEDWDARLNAFPRSTVFQSVAWLRFLQKTQPGSEIVTAALVDGDKILGYFAGLKVNKYGLGILGSPFRGWTSGPMGLVVSDGIGRSAALQPLVQFAFERMGCLHLEVMDRDIDVSDLDGLPCDFEGYSTYEVDLTLSEDALFRRMSHQCRGCIRKAIRSGIVVEEAADLEFADEYYDQLQATCTYRNTWPIYTIDRVRCLIRTLKPANSLLLLRARLPDGTCIATSVSVGRGKAAYLWGMTSRINYRHLRPSELLLWYTMRFWKRRGIETFGIGDLRNFGRKFRAREVQIPWFRISKSSWIAFSRLKAEAVVRWWLRSRSRLEIKRILGNRAALPLPKILL